MLATCTSSLISSLFIHVFTLKTIFFSQKKDVAFANVSLFAQSGGYFANSLAIMTDAAHLLSDFAGFMISLLALWVATKPATTTLSFGWHRAGNEMSQSRSQTFPLESTGRLQVLMPPIKRNGHNVKSVSPTYITLHIV